MFLTKQFLKKIVLILISFLIFLYFALNCCNITTQVYRPILGIISAFQGLIIVNFDFPLLNYFFPTPPLTFIASTVVILIIFINSA